MHKPIKENQIYCRQKLQKKDRAIKGADRFVSLLLVAIFMFWMCMTSTDVQADITSLNTGKYGVFIGIDKSELKAASKKIAKYQTIVIDAQSFDKTQIRKWKAQGHIVYSYLNVGSISKSRSYYKKFKKYVLKPYNHWPGEYWMDVSQKEWQNKMIETGKNCLAKGVDGLFIDNTDIYYQYPKKAIYQGLENIVKGLNRYTSRIIINGGDRFVKKLIEKKKTKYIYGVNQESVFSRVTDYEKNIFKKQTKYNRTYYEKYLKRCKKAGLKVHIIEYTKDRELAKNIKKYCKKEGYQLYLTNNIRLE